MNSNTKLNITHLVLSGGGMHGVAYIGAFRYLYLENIHKNITHIAANSVGSFIGLMLAFRLTIEEMENIIYSTFNHPPFRNVARKDFYKLFSDFGISTTEHVTHMLKSYLKTKYHDIEDIQNLSFQNLSKHFGINMYISATNISKCKHEMFSIETTPNVSVFKACEASMSIPFIYKAVYIGDSYYYDGAITNNFPIDIIKNVPNDNILGIVLDKNDNTFKASDKKLNLFTIFGNIFYILDKYRQEEVLLKKIQNKKEYILTINHFPTKHMDYDFKKEGITLKLTIDQINEMILIGFQHMSEYIKKRLAYQESINQILLDNIT
jgi:predicted acylesterase/phospholipase RssA